MKKQELVKNFLNSALPNETKIYEITEKNIKLAGIDIEVSDCLNESGEPVFSPLQTALITNMGELREYINRGYLPSRIDNYTPTEVLKVYIEDLTGEPFNPRQLFWI